MRGSHAMDGYTRQGRPGILEDIAEEVYRNYDRVYGKNKWRIVGDDHNSYLEVRDAVLDPAADIYFVTTNRGKLESARRGLGRGIRLAQIALDIAEDEDDIEAIARRKARVGYAVLCRPVMCDDSGFFIPSQGGYPGIHVGRELREHGIGHFLAFAKEGPIDAHWAQTLGFFDESLFEPRLFTSRSEGVLLGEQRGDFSAPFLKSPLGTAWIPRGSRKTIAEMSEEEYKALAQTDRWAEMAEFLRKRS